MSDYSGRAASVLRDQVRELEAENGRLKRALIIARQEVINLARAGVERLKDYGAEVDPAERTYEPLLARIDAAE